MSETVSDSTVQYRYVTLDMGSGPQVVTFSSMLNNGQVHVGWAVSNVGERPNKKMGRTIADGRREVRPVIFRRIAGSKNFCNDFAASVLNDDACMYTKHVHALTRMANAIVAEAGK